MIYLSNVPLEQEEIINLLKRDIQLKEVCQRILYQRIINKAAKERDLTVTEEEIQTEADRQRREKRLEKAADTLSWLADQILTADDWEVGIHNSLLAQKLAESLFAKEVKKFFAQNQANFEQVSLYQIIVRSEQLAQEIFYQIEEREISFYEAAHLYDIDEKRRQQCGYMGKFYRWSVKPDIAAVVFSGKPGEVLGPVPVERNYHLLMVQEFIPAELTPEKYQELLDKMFKEWLAIELSYMIHSKPD